MIQQSHPKDWVGKAANLPMALLGNLETGRKGTNAADSWSSPFCEFTWGHGIGNYKGSRKGPSVPQCSGGMVEAPGLNISQTSETVLFLSPGENNLILNSARGGHVDLRIGC